MSSKLSSGNVLLFCTQNIFAAIAILILTSQKVNAGIDNCRQLDSSFDTIQETSDDIRHVIDVMSRTISEDVPKSILSEKILAANKAITGFHMQIFPCFFFLNTNRYPMACQNAYQVMGVVVGLIRKNILKPAKEIASSSGNTKSMVKDFMNSESSTTRQINSNMINVNGYFRLCRQS
jgi:hypothetical protein